MSQERPGAEVAHTERDGEARKIEFPEVIVAEKLNLIASEAMSSITSIMEDLGVELSDEQHGQIRLRLFDHVWRRGCELFGLDSSDEPFVD